MDAMTGESLRRSITITNPNGFHLRPIRAFVETAGKFRSDVLLAKDGSPPVSGKSPLGLLGMAAEQGTVLHLEVCGPDSEQAFKALVEVLERNWPEEEEA